MQAWPYSRLCLSASSLGVDFDKLNKVLATNYAGNFFSLKVMGAIMFLKLKQKV